MDQFVQNTDIEQQPLLGQTYTDSFVQSSIVPYSQLLKCNCPCSAVITNNPFLHLLGLNLTKKELEQKMRARLNDLMTTLALPKNETMKYKSKRKTATDNRVSSRTIGCVGGIIIAAIILLFVGLDLLVICTLCVQKNIVVV